LPFITLGAVLRPVVDYLRLASSLSFADLSVVPDLSVVVVLGAIVSAVFFSSLALAAGLSVPTAGLVVGLAPPGATFLSTTCVTPPALILSLRLSSMGSASSLLTVAPFLMPPPGYLSAVVLVVAAVFVVVVVPAGLPVPVAGSFLF